MNEILEKIQDLELTRTEARIADYFAENLETIGLQTSSTLADALQVSDTSLIRFVRKLGYPSYLDFRAEMNERITKQYTKAPPERVPEEDADAAPNARVQEAGAEILENLRRTFSRLDDQTVQRAVDMLIHSEHKVIAGFHTTAGCASYMAARLGQLLPHVIPMTTADAASVEGILDTGPEDCLMVYSFMHHARINAPLMEIARQNGTKILLVTDKVSSPLAKKADLVLLAPIDDGSVYSYAAPLSITEVLLITIIRQSGTDCEERLHRLEALLKSAKLY